MKKILLVFAVAFSFSACEFQSFKDFEYPPYDGEFEWTQLTRHADWPARYGHAALAFQDKLWIFGGYNPGVVKGDTYFEDVWNSSDGISWQEVTAQAPWHGRRGHQVIVFNDGSGEAMYLIGGFSVNEETGYRQYANDVWKSVDGFNWEEIKPVSQPDIHSEEDWFPRFNHSLVQSNYQGTPCLYIIGGASMLQGVDSRYAMKYFNDVWRSTDAVHWVKLQANDFGIRSEAGAAVDPASGKIYVQGGIHGVIFESTDQNTHPIENWHWLWSSTDGENWIMESGESFDESLLWRSDHALVWYHNALWSLPGKTTSNVHYHYTSGNHYPVWKYDIDNGFAIDSRGCDIDPRHGYATAEMNDKIYIIGGYTSAHGQSNDVWSGQIN